MSEHDPMKSAANYWHDRYNLAAEECLQKGLKILELCKELEQVKENRWCLRGDRMENCAVILSLRQENEGLRNECDHCIHKARISTRDMQKRAEAAEGKVAVVMRGICIMLDSYDAVEDLSEDEELLVKDLQQFKQILEGKRG